MFLDTNAPYAYRLNVGHLSFLLDIKRYQEDNLKGVDVKDYFVKLNRGLFDSSNIRKDQIDLQLDIDSISLDIDTVVPIGLVVNELVSNSLKYAFPDKKQGQIKVSLREQNDYLALRISDDGVGMTAQEISKIGHSFHLVTE